MFAIITAANDLEKNFGDNGFIGPGDTEFDVFSCDFKCMADFLNFEALK
jgi:hypothetical protein